MSFEIIHELIDDDGALEDLYYESYSFPQTNLPLRVVVLD